MRNDQHPHGNYVRPNIAQIPQKGNVCRLIDIQLRLFIKRYCEKLRQPHFTCCSKLSRSNSASKPDITAIQWARKIITTLYPYMDFTTQPTNAIRLNYVKLYPQFFFLISLQEIYFIFYLYFTRIKNIFLYLTL